jgi:hypothetical protein
VYTSLVVDTAHAPGGEGTSFKLEVKTEGSPSPECVLFVVASQCESRITMIVQVNNILSGTAIALLHYSLKHDSF